MHSKNKNLEVVLAGWRRQYVMNRLQNSDIKYHYFEMPSFETVNKLYNSIDLYVVGSRFEGGPQALLECAMTKTSIISTNVGMAEDILDNESILDINIRRAVPNIDVAYDKVQKYLIPNWFDSYKTIFKEVLNG
jgi:glycosyltransferase involved in cell wall biosynthesis